MNPRVGLRKGMAAGLDRPENQAHLQGKPTPPPAVPEEPKLSPEEQLRLMRLARRLNEAAGYLELGMPEKTLAILDELGDVGPFAPGAALLRGEALRLQERFSEAGASFELAARFIPPPFDRPAYFASSMCYRQAGDLDRAINLLGWARGALPPYKQVLLRRISPQDSQQRNFNDPRYPRSIR